MQTMETAEMVDRCIVCADPVDYCIGHGDRGQDAYTLHDDGDHDLCDPAACESAPLTRCPDCGGALQATETRTVYQSDVTVRFGPYGPEVGRAEEWDTADSDWTVYCENDCGRWQDARWAGLPRAFGYR